MEIEQIITLPQDIQGLVLESQSEGFRFLQRLIDEFDSDENRFNGPGEILLAIRDNGTLIAIGGMSNCNGVGRLRRFYVSQLYRRAGVGRRLLKQLENYASSSFSQVVLFTDTLAAGRFYESCGYVAVHEEHLSHRKTLTSHQ
ncbi:GNAT family N-acetyltransferase [Photobacterium sp. MCCC 1A19761]|uniref:GNAT family N-acetyltransferase n=1 Tax=Photobacterium sp. MCCC 1A19761 TaxID=3115000 RepID=UPI00307D5797